MVRRPVPRVEYLSRLNGRALMASAQTSRHVIITGAAQGIGKATALRAIKEGWKVVALDNDERELAELVSEVNTQFGSSVLKAYSLDVSRLPQIEAFFEWLADQSIHPYALVNNAAILLGMPLLEYLPEKIELMLSINLLGPIYMTQYFGKLLSRQNSSGVIVNLASLAGQIGSPRDPIYAVAKAGVLGLTFSSARALSPNIRVNAVCPAIVYSGLMKNVTAERKEAVRQASLVKTNTMPEDVANTIWFLLSDESAHYSGASFDINNGYNVR
jgi:3-oxoacyl-[acyl-carrier protein] reductase